jgi:hypothetical protein
MSEDKFEIKINVPMIKELVSDKIYRSDASAFREQYVNALSHGCVAYHEKYGYDDDVKVTVVFDYGLRKVTITDNGMGMPKSIFSDNFMSFGFSTVDKETNNTRSGMFGLGAISFFRIATACIVESWDRETDERFTFMTRNTDESEFVENRTLEDYGTKTEIFLKESVRIESLIHMVQNIAENYPVKTVLETINSEQEQTIATYNDTDGDMYLQYERVEKFSQYVDKMTNNMNVCVVDDEDYELYISTKGGNRNHTFLCRVPIDIGYSTGFTTYLNIKKEKIPGTDSKGKPKLQEVPKPDRDEVNEIAQEVFSKKIEKAVDNMLYDIKITNFNEYTNSTSRWILDGYSVDDKLNRETHKFVQQMREPVKYRESNGIQKRHESLLTIHSRFRNVMYHPSLHKGTFESIKHYLAKQELKVHNENLAEGETKLTIENWPKEHTLAMVNEMNGLPLTDAKQFKKDKKIKAVVTTGGGASSPRGILVRDGSYSGARIEASNIEDSLKKYPGGLYFADGLLTQSDIRNTYFNENETSKWFVSLNARNKVGIIISKKGEKLYPSIRTLLDDIIQASKDGLIQYKRHGIKENKFTKIDFTGNFSEIPNSRNSYIIEAKEGEPTQDEIRLNVLRYLESLYQVLIIPEQCQKSLPHLKFISNEIMTIPAKFIQLCRILSSTYDVDRQLSVIRQIKYSPWTKNLDESTSKFIWNQYDQMSNRYDEPNYECRDEVMKVLAKIKIEKMEPNEDEFYEMINEAAAKHNQSRYGYNINYEKTFPHLYLAEKAKRLGYEETVADKDEWGDTIVKGYTEKVRGLIPIEIDGQYYAKYVDEPSHCRPMKDDQGNAIIIDPTSNEDIVLKNGKLVFMEEIQ